MEELTSEMDFMIAGFLRSAYVLHAISLAISKCRLRMAKYLNADFLSLSRLPDLKRL